MRSSGLRWCTSKKTEHLWAALRNRFEGRLTPRSPGATSALLPTRASNCDTSTALRKLSEETCGGVPPSPANWMAPAALSSAVDSSSVDEGSGYFTYDVVSRHPGALFREVMISWMEELERAASESPRTPVRWNLREVQLLNCRTLAWCGSGVQDKSLQDRPLMEYARSASKSTPWLPRLTDPSYSVAHFAAELGDATLLHRLSQLQGGLGMLVRQASLSMECVVDDVVEELSPSCYSMDIIARDGYDCTGFYLAHYAAAGGHIDVLSYLLELLGPHVVLDEQKVCPVGRNIWGQRHHTRGMRVSALAAAYGQFDLLEWLQEHHPLHGELWDEDLLPILIIAALGDRPQTFEHAWDRQTGIDGEPATRFCKGPWHTALLAAAEGGSLRVLEWYVQRFGVDVLWQPNRMKAHAIHYCARGAQASILRHLFTEHQTAFCKCSAYQHVDAEDRYGRTPAVWCVAGNARSSQATATLMVLREMGSSWPMWQGADSQGTLLDVAKCTRSPFSALCQYIRNHLIPSN